MRGGGTYISSRRRVQGSYEDTHFERGMLDGMGGAEAHVECGHGRRRCGGKQGVLMGWKEGGREEGAVGAPSGRFGHRHETSGRKAWDGALGRQTSPGG
jgi:hypothetical protein